MLKRNTTMLAAALFLSSAVCVAEAAKSAHDTGMSIGKKRGYPNPGCYATVFAAYASQGADGKFHGPRGKGANTYKGELFSRCGISL